LKYSGTAPAALAADAAVSQRTPVTIIHTRLFIADEYRRAAPRRQRALA
jgi:hypothetical protein